GLTWLPWGEDGLADAVVLNLRKRASSTRKRFGGDAERHLLSVGRLSTGGGGFGHEGGGHLDRGADAEDVEDAKRFFFSLHLGGRKLLEFELRADLVVGG